jgi:carbon storage regulator
VLHITRRAGETIRIGDDIVIEIEEIGGSHVRLGVHAPRDVRVYREEIWQAVEEENRAAASADADVPAPARADADEG